MLKRGVNLQKIARMSAETFLNALRLHEDSVTLYECGSYASAYFLSVLSLEELGKVTLLEDFVWHSRIERNMNAADEEEYIRDMFKHQHKQARFARHSEELVPKRMLENLRNGKIETIKQNAVYVGLDRKAGKVNLKGRIISPFKVQQAKAKEQITVVHDYLVTFTLGVVKGIYVVDTNYLEQLIDEELVATLKHLWKGESNKARRLIQKLERAT